MKGDDSIKNCPKENILNNFLKEHAKYKACPFKYINNTDKIEIGNVKTINYDEEAKIIDDKKGNIHILNFMIPRGFNGQSDTIKVGDVITVDSKNNAKVIDKTGSPKHVLDFYIPKGEKGASTSSTEAIFFSDFNKLTSSGEMIFNNKWFIPNDQETFNILDESKVEIIPGIYEISISGLVAGINNDNSCEIYLMTNKKEAVKDLNFKFPKGSNGQNYFSKTTLFRFDEKTSLNVTVDIIDDIQNSISIEEVNLILKKIYE